MTTLVAAPTLRGLPDGAVPVDHEGLLIGVQRPCPDHPAPRCGCVATAPAGGMVFWCEPGQHHFTARPDTVPTA